MTDEQARIAAIDPRQSVIVQAPAGSGKTTLLVDRYLVLLASVEAPEQILAVTFTRKAASDMRSRVLDTLRAIVRGEPTTSSLAAAERVALQEKVNAWHVLDSPQRLLIRTIDSFNVALARAMPIATALGPAPSPADHTFALYRAAARRVLELVDSNDALAADVERLLDWRDHRARDVEDLLAGLLGKREQWLRALAGDEANERPALEAALEVVIVEQMERASAVLADALQSANANAESLLGLLRFAAHALVERGESSPATAFATVESLPEAATTDLEPWAGLRAALLTKDGKLRKRVTKTEGFAAQVPETRAFNALLGALVDNTEFVEALDVAGTLPSPRYADDEWDVLAALLRVLRRAARELSLLFAERGESDHTGIAAAALNGLGDDERGYTDLGLALDARIQHLLVDEFQDTNHAQLSLLEKLTAGWTPNDGRTLFLVGDPMQSIYRFREADVGLFVGAREHGVNRSPLTALRLERNFRSRAEIIDWVNTHVGATFPRVENIASGAVRYAPSVATRGSGGDVTILPRATPADEAEAIALHLAKAFAAHRDDAEFRAAIIVRRRSDLRDILPALARHRIAYRALALDPLVERPVVQDLLAITRAVRQPADVTALLALLRSPMCGLALAELHALQGDGASIHDSDALDQLEAPARRRAARVYRALAAARDAWRRQPMRDVIEGVWHSLGGPACRASEQIDGALRDAEAFLQLLADADAHGLLDDWNAFIERLAGEFTTGDPPREDVRLEILTMHGAKGLEWDLVVLPRLERGHQRADRHMLHWLSLTTDDGVERLLLAPLRAAAEPKNTALVDLIDREQRARTAYENQRLLYVACTRAKESLVLGAVLAPDDDGHVEPSKGSLLAELWKTVAEQFTSELAASTPADAGTSATSSSPPRVIDRLHRRVELDWQPSRAPALKWQPKLAPRIARPEVEYNWAGAPARRIGTVLHRLLEHAGTLGVERIDASERQRMIGRIPLLLAALGARTDERDAAVLLVRTAFEQTLDSELGRWILSGQHADATCELAIAGVRDGALDNAIIDRTFVADGVRWIIDYKSGHHVGADLELFLQQERDRYEGQLARYRDLFAHMDSRPIKTALFLPRHQRLEVVHA